MMVTGYGLICQPFSHQPVLRDGQPALQQPAIVSLFDINSENSSSLLNCFLLIQTHTVPVACYYSRILCLVTLKKGVKTWKTSEYSHPKDKLIVLGNGNEHNANLLIYNNQPHKSGNNRDAIEKIKSTQGQK